MGHDNVMNEKSTGRLNGGQKISSYLLDEKVRSLLRFTGTAGWRVGLTTGGCTRSGVVIPVTRVVPDYDMARRDKLFDFANGVGSSTVLETTLGLKSPD